MDELGFVTLCRKLDSQIELVTLPYRDQVIASVMASQLVRKCALSRDPEMTWSEIIRIMRNHFDDCIKELGDNEDTSLQKL